MKNIIFLALVSATASPILHVGVVIARATGPKASMCGKMNTFQLQLPTAILHVGAATSGIAATNVLVGAIILFRGGKRGPK